MVSKHGFTLLEFIVGFAIIGLVSILIAAIYIAHWKIFANQSRFIDVSTQNKQAVDVITNLIRESQGVVSTCCNGETSGANSIILEYWPIDPNSGEPVYPNGNYDYIIIKLDPTTTTNLIQKIIPSASSARQASTKIIAIGVTSLQFAYNNSDPTLSQEVTATVTATQISNGKSQSATQSINATLRNK